VGCDDRLGQDDASGAEERSARGDGSGQDDGSALAWRDGSGRVAADDIVAAESRSVHSGTA
jgi:hypothetical protein